MELPPRIKRGLIAFALFDLIVLVVLVSLFSVRSERTAVAELRNLGATIYPEPLPLESFELRDQLGNSFGRENLGGHWTLIFFGYTSCPDICPLTMAELKQFYEGMDDSSLKEQLRIVMVTVDPARDTPATMAAYVESFNPEFVGLSGDHNAIADLASQLFVAFEQASPQTSSQVNHEEHETQIQPGDIDGYLVEHNGHIAVINPDGDYYAVLRAPHRDRDIALALETITQL